MYDFLFLLDGGARRLGWALVDDLDHAADEGCHVTLEKGLEVLRLALSLLDLFWELVQYVLLLRSFVKSFRIADLRAAMGGW